MTRGSLPSSPRKWSTRGMLFSWDRRLLSKTRHIDSSQRRERRCARDSLRVRLRVSASPPPHPIPLPRDKRRQPCGAWESRNLFSVSVPVRLPNACFDSRANAIPSRSRILSDGTIYVGEEEEDPSLQTRIPGVIIQRRKLSSRAKETECACRS